MANGGGGQWRGSDYGVNGDRECYFDLKFNMSPVRLLLSRLNERLTIEQFAVANVEEEPEEEE